MRKSQREKGKSRLKIVSSASRQFREKGLDATNVADVMNDAGMTHGGFYRHFESKTALEKVAIQESFSEAIGYLKEVTAKSPSDQLAKYRSFYLSKEHFESPGMGCPVAALAQEVSRGVEENKVEFTDGITQMLEELSKFMRGSSSERFEKSAREFASLVGALVLARSVTPEMSKAILKACR